MLFQHPTLLLLHLCRHHPQVEHSKLSHWWQQETKSIPHCVFPASPLGGAVAPAITLPLQSPQVLMLPVPSAPPAPPAGQKLQTLQYLRRPDGRLFQLVPISQLTTVQLRQRLTGKHLPSPPTKDSSPSESNSPQTVILQLRMLFWDFGTSISTGLSFKNIITRTSMVLCYSRFFSTGYFCYCSETF